MITIQVSQEEVKKPEVYEAMIQLLGQLSGVQEVAIPSETKAQKVRRKNEQVGEPDIDPEIQVKYGPTVSKAKSLYFLSIIKRNQTVDSLQIQAAMKKHYPHMTRKSIGGITGAVSRWFQKHSQVLPYESANDKTRNGIHIFTWVGDLALDQTERQEMLDQIPARHRVSLNKLLDTGSIGKDELGNRFTSFLKAVNSLETDRFENEGNKIILRRS